MVEDAGEFPTVSSLLPVAELLTDSGVSSLLIPFKSTYVAVSSPLPCGIIEFPFFFIAINRPYSEILAFLLSNPYIILYTGTEDGRFSSENPSK